MRKNILVISAHPDDEVLGCGGVVARFAQEGHQVSVLILGEGMTSRGNKKPDTNWVKEIKALKEKAKKANMLLGVASVTFYDLPDNRFDTVPLLEIIKLVEEGITNIKPEVLFTHSKLDLNIDHVITHRAVLTAARPLQGCPVKEVYAFEIPSSTEWAFGQFGAFQPDTFFNIGNTLEAKIKALEIYDSEIREFPHPRSPEAIKSLAKRWGSVVGIEHAEAFETVRRVC